MLIVLHNYLDIQDIFMYVFFFFLILLFALYELLQQANSPTLDKVILALNLNWSLTN